MDENLGPVSEASDEELVRRAGLSKGWRSSKIESAHAELTRRSIVAFRESADRISATVDRLEGTLGASTKLARSLNKLTWALLIVTFGVGVIALLQLLKT